MQAGLKANPQSSSARRCCGAPAAAAGRPAGAEPIRRRSARGGSGRGAGSAASGRGCRASRHWAWWSESQTDWPHGIDLSGGETQKIVATRTLLDNADIWIFDEPVAAMDPSSEYSFFNTVLEEDDKSKTMIFVSHRLKIASKMNRIIYLENGKIVGIGTHQQLMTGCEKYRRYYVSWLLMEND